MNIKSLRDLQLLNDISSEAVLTQRSIAQKRGLALGLTNLLIRRLAQKGYIEIVGLHRNKIRYLITAQGLAAKARLTYEYLEYSLFFYRQLRSFLTYTLAKIDRVGGSRVLLYGTGEMAEIIFLLLQRDGLRVVAVVADSADEKVSFMNQPVRSPADLGTLSFDWVVVAALKGAQEAAARLEQWGVPREKVIAIPDGQMPELRETLPDARIVSSVTESTDR